MRKRVFIPLFVLFVFFPLIVYVMSYTRFFNDEVRDILISVVDSGTQARLRLGEIHGSVFGTFTVDGAALLYRGKPIASVDTLTVSHLPLSLITKTVQVTQATLIHPRFYLIRSRDGTFNINHIGKPGGVPGGKFDWTILAKSLKIVGGEFELFDSTAAGSGYPTDRPVSNVEGKTFDASRFTVRNVNMAASAELSGENLTANVRQMSMRVEPIGFKVDSLSFGFYTAPAGTEVNGFHLASGRMMLDVDVTLEGQDLLDTLNAGTIRNKYFTANIEAIHGDVRKVGDFVKLPIRTPSDFNLSLFASGTLDTLDVKQCLLKTDSSTMPLSASFHNLLDSTLSMKVKMEHASVDMTELSSVLQKVGFPNVRSLGKMDVSASIAGRPSELTGAVKLTNGFTSIVAQSRLNPGAYQGSVIFNGLDVGEVFPGSGMRTRLNGKSEFQIALSRRHFPEGNISLSIDSSSFDHTLLHHVGMEFSSTGDSLSTDFNLLTSRGNVNGVASLNLRDRAYSGDFKFSEFNAAPFLHLPTLKGSLTGRLLVDGRGLNVDSLRTQVTFMTERSTLGNVDLGSSVFSVVVNTQNPDKQLEVYSPFVDAHVIGDFVPHELPGQLAGLFSTLADTFGSKFAGLADTAAAPFRGFPDMDAIVTVDVKDARILGQLLGNIELMGNANTRFHLVADRKMISISGYLSADTVNFREGSLNLFGGRINVGFKYKSDPRLSVWNSGGWSVDANAGSFGVGGTTLAAQYLHVDYSAGGDSTEFPTLTLRARGAVDTLVNFAINAQGRLVGNEFDLTTDSLNGNIYGVPLVSEAPVAIRYSPETFTISPATFNAGLSDERADSLSLVTASGSYSLQTGANLHFIFHNFGLRSLQEIARLDTTTLNLKGRINGMADLHNSKGTTALSIDFGGKNIHYNGAVARSIKGKVGLNGPVMTVNAELSKEADSARYALQLNGTIPLSAKSSSQMRVELSADSLNVSFLTPFLSGIDDFGGYLSGNMVVSGQYSSPEMKGKLSLAQGRIRLAANDVNYLLAGTVIGDGDMLRLSPLSISNIPGQPGGTITANGAITIGENTIKKFDLSFDGNLLVLNSSASRTLHGIYGTAVIGSGSGGLRLDGSLDRPMLLGTLNIESADLTLLPIQRSENLANQEIIYHFPAPPNDESPKAHRLISAVPSPQTTSGSLIDSLRYDVQVETKDNMSLRMIFDPMTNEELDAVLGGRLHLSNLSGNMELTGSVNLASNSNSYYNFYGKHFNATGRLSFTGDPLNPIMNITAQYHGELDTTTTATSTGKPEPVVVQLGISGTFNHPNAPSISMTVNGLPYDQGGDVQTNAMWFILTNQLASQVTSPVKQSIADNLWNKAGPGLLSAGTSVLSGALTSLFSREFSFIRSAELRYSSINSLTNPDLAITAQFAKATIHVGGQVFSDINNTDVSLDYPLTELLGNMLYLQLSHKIVLNNQTYYQREAVNALRLFYQLSF